MHPNSTLRLSTFPLVAALAFACGPSPGGSTSGGGDGGGDAGAVLDAQVPSTGPIPREVGPLAVAQAICNKVARCGCNWATSAPCNHEQVCTASTCVVDYTRQYQSADMLAATTGRVYDPQGARDCVDAVAAADCLDVDYVNICTILWNGTQPIGASCSATQACQTSKAAPADCSTAGVCVAMAAGSHRIGVAMGAPCSGTCSASGSQCVARFGAPGGICQVSQGLACIAGTCQTLRKQGDACSGEFDCADPLTCLSNACAPRLAQGSPCTLSSGYNTCNVGSGCVASVCASLKPNGQPCSTSNECLENRCVGGQCIREFALPICGG